MAAVFTSATEIANVALSLLGAQEIVDITDGDDNQKERVLAALHYGRVRDAVLRAHHWNFATKRVELALLVSAPSHEYAYEFSMPADFLKMIRTKLEAEGGVDDYRIEHNGTATVLRSHDDEVFIEYTAQVTNVALYDSLFIDCFTALLAAEMSYALTEKAELGESLRKIYTDKLREARTTDAQEGTPRTAGYVSWIDERV